MNRARHGAAQALSAVLLRLRRLRDAFAARWPGRGRPGASEGTPSPEPGVLDLPTPAALRRTRGQKVCIAAAALLLLCGSAALIVSCCWGPRPPVTREPVGVSPPVGDPLPGPITLPTAALLVQVRLARGAGELQVGAAAGGRWHGVEPHSWQRQAGGGPWDVRARGGRLYVAGEALPGGEAVFTPGDGLFELNGSRYRGELWVSADHSGGLTAMEVVEVEDYVRGVVPLEMPPRWPRDALMAQAVAARTFALYRMSAPNAKRNYLTEVDMAYGGADAESSATDQAVRATDGVLLWYDGAPLPAYFHSTCGGHTSPVEGVFGEKPLPPLSSVECRWCTASRYYRWRVVIEAPEIIAKLAAWGVTNLHSLRPGDPDAGGRSQTVLVNGTKRLGTNEFRLAVGASRLRSTSFTVTLRGRAFDFFGRGWGHGVGMCQWGACGMAREGMSWRRILEHYYPGAELVRTEQR